MKKKELKELRTKPLPELKELIKKTQEELARLKLEKEIGKLKNVCLIRIKRADLARLKTILKERELNENA